MPRPRDFDDDRDEDARRDAIDDRRQRFNGCKCGHPDMPGYCPGWRACPMCAQPDETEST
jgi:hypothetical protein